MALAELPGLDSLNAMPVAEVERALLACCASTRWAERVAAGRPYLRAEELYVAADAALAALDEADLDSALLAHPRIGERSPSAHGGFSAREQSGVSRSAAATLQGLADGNAEYEARFGHVYLVCADGRSGEELLAVLQERLGNDPATERMQVRQELGKINRIRLRRLIGATSSGAGTGASGKWSERMNGVTTHVLDAALGRPAVGVPVRLEAASGAILSTHITDEDGRVPDLVSGRLESGTYRLCFDTAAYFSASDRSSFYPEVVITFAVADPEQHYHVPLLLSPFAYSTYRGS